MFRLTLTRWVWTKSASAPRAISVGRAEVDFSVDFGFDIRLFERDADDRTPRLLRHGAQRDISACIWPA
jgi:hypothetical protein